MAELCSDTESLVRLPTNPGSPDIDRLEEKPEKCEISRPTPQLPDKKPWMSPMLPTPLENRLLCLTRGGRVGGKVEGNVSYV